MAADVTLIALPDRQIGQFHARQILAYRLQSLLFDDDEATAFLDGQIVRAGQQRDSFDQWFYELLYAGPGQAMELGPWSPLKMSLTGDDGYVPTRLAVVWEIWSEGAVVTPGLVGRTMAALSLPDNSLYKGWGKRGTGHGKRKWRSLRPNRPRHIKRWLNNHLGDLVWVESW